MQFSNTLIYWYLQNRRDLPWRKTKNPYLIWLSESILQQTRIDQGLNYYLKFRDHFPTVFDLAKAEEETILKLWQGLGYYSRARNLHFSARYIVTALTGKFPKTYTELLKLKGVGDYTASAIASICYNESTAVVDGNEYRVLARYFGIDTPINSSKGIKDFKKLAQRVKRHTSQDFVRHARQQIVAMIKQAESLASQQERAIIGTASDRMASLQQSELERLQALALINPKMLHLEIDQLKEESGGMQHFLDSAHIPLAALRVAVVTDK